MRTPFRVRTWSLFVLFVSSAARAAAPTPEFDPFAPAEQRVHAQFARIEQEIARLRNVGLSAQADEMRSDLSYFQLQLAGARPTRVDGPNLDWIGLYEGPGGSTPPPPVDVTVQATDRPVILALTSFEPVNWRLNVQPGAQLDRVIVYGANGASMPVGLPGIVPIELYSRGTAHGLVYAYEKNYDNFLTGIRGMHALTGFESISFQGAHSAEGRSFSIGRTNIDWRAQRVLDEMRPLYEQATEYGRAQQRAAVAGHRFVALLRTPLNDRWTRQAALAQFTPFSAVYDTIRPLDGRVEHLAFDPTSGRYFGSMGHRVYEIDPDSGGLTQLAGQPFQNPLISHPSGMTFDTKRGRLITATLGGAGELYSYHPDTGQWALLASLNNLDLQGLTYVETEDAFYGMSKGGNSGSGIESLIPDLIRFNADGQVTRRVSIATRLPIDSEWGHQLFTVGDQLGLLTRAVPDLDRPIEDAASRFLLIDPATGDVTYSGIIVVPEPGTVLLVIACGVVLTRRRRRASRLPRSCS